MISSLEFVSHLRWLDGSPLMGHVEDYRQKIFAETLDTRDEHGRPRYNQVLTGRAKKIGRAPT
jgi:hypothetical protein